VLNSAKQGKHRRATFTTQAAPAAAGAAEVGIYSANGPVSAVPELFINKTASQVPFTESLKNTQGWTWLPSGIMFQWGAATMVGGASSVVVALPRAFPGGILSVVATPNTLPAGSYTDNILAIVQTDVSHVTAYRKTNFGTACTFNYLAIGY
jgi:hypothetical protein